LKGVEVRQPGRVKTQPADERGTGPDTSGIANLGNFAPARWLREYGRKLNERLRAQIEHQQFFPGRRRAQYNAILHVTARGLAGTDPSQQAQKCPQQEHPSATRAYRDRPKHVEICSDLAAHFCRTGYN
jgi:hypothetical protein